MTADTAQAPTLPTHEQGLALFDQTLTALQIAGWTRKRIDTFTHPANAHQGRLQMTIRHHYDHGTWELYYEPDRYWNPNGVPSVTRVAKIRLDRPLPQDGTVQVINDLFGPEVGRYFPATGGYSWAKSGIKK